jgi:hypothetical protein
MGTYCNEDPFAQLFFGLGRILLTLTSTVPPVAQLFVGLSRMLAYLTLTVPIM